jgi:hypothetical protein
MSYLGAIISERLFSLIIFVTSTDAVTFVSSFMLAISNTG